mgnify:CR=1 FL=1
MHIIAADDEDLFELEEKNDQEFLKALVEKYPDWVIEKDGKRCFLEVKGVTLENDGVCAFPDAPTQRGARHLRELTKAVGNGYGAYVLFVIQMADVKYLHPNDATDPEFGKALREAAANGVEVLAVDCDVTTDEMKIGKFVPVIL